MFYRDDGGRDDTITTGVGLPRTPGPAVSLILAVGGIVLLAFRPDLLSDRPAIIERIAQAALLIGIVGAAMHGLGLRPARQLSRIAADPRFCWPALLLGAAYLLWTGS